MGFNLIVLLRLLILSVLLTATACASSKVQVVADPPSRTPAGSDEIDRVTEIIHEPKLREISLPDGDIEVRLWSGVGGITNLRGHILRRRGGVWSGVSVVEDGFDKKEDRFKYRGVPMRVPSEGWDSIWAQLLSHNILTLPDAETIGCNEFVQDGWDDIFEIRIGDQYRTYSYANPETGRCHEANDAHAMEAIFDHTYDWGI